MFGLSVMELVVVIIILLLVFGAVRLPALGEALGKSVRNFKKGMAADAPKLAAPANDAAPGPDDSKKS